MGSGSGYQKRVEGIGAVTRGLSFSRLRAGDEAGKLNGRSSKVTQAEIENLNKSVNSNKVNWKPKSAHTQCLDSFIDVFCQLLKKTIISINCRRPWKKRANHTYKTNPK